MKISWKKHRLIFKKAAGTSRTVLYHKDVWYILIEEKGRKGIGECNPLVGLSIDDREDFEEQLNDFSKRFEENSKIELDLLSDFPSMKFGFEMALKDLETGGKRILFDSEFSRGESSIPINGLLWMASKDDMLAQLEKKLEEGFTCIKMKIGAINFEDELAILKAIRKNFKADEIEIRVDANGAFKAEEALSKLEKLAFFDIHSIEQPIHTKQWEEMRYLCKSSPIKIALDEELIGLKSKDERMQMMEMIHPDFIILKPSLIGGFSDSDEWIAIAEKNKVGWWITSALESNIGLNAIAQYSYTKNVRMPQGLGTGALYSNNIDSPLFISDGALYYDINGAWGEL